MKIWLLWIGVVASCSSALAVQTVEISAREVPLLVAPRVDSEKIVILTRGTVVQASSNTIRDSEGEQWYKIRAPGGQLGFIRAVNVVTRIDKGDSRAAGVQRGWVRAEERTSTAWSFALRASGFGSYTTRHLNRLLGLDGELTFCFLGGVGYERRRFSIGPALIFTKTSRIVAGSLVYRFFSPFRSEPELRFRLGRDTSSSRTVVGLNAALRYPFSISEGTHLSGHLDTGLIVFTPRPYALDVSLGMGLGLHF